MDSLFGNRDLPVILANRKSTTSLLNIFPIEDWMCKLTREKKSGVTLAQLSLILHWNRRKFYNQLYIHI